jgi:predicted DNA binding protein
VVEQFTASKLNGESTATQVTDDEAPDGVALETVFDYGSQAVYEFEREGGSPCICEVIEDAVGPITDAYARDGDLYVTVHTTDMDAIREVIGSLEADFGDVRVEYLARSREESEESEVVPVDLRNLTDRQREVVRTAYRMGYFEYPREANAGNVAAALDIGTSTFTEHLNVAQSKILDELLSRG